ncbi:MAG: hypothetical protein GY711_27740 [bacterium]|nr:hypothetical protein [bacterium]
MRRTKSIRTCALAAVLFACGCSEPEAVPEEHRRVTELLDQVTKDLYTGEVDPVRIVDLVTMYLDVLELDGQSYDGDDLVVPMAQMSTIENAQLTVRRFPEHDMRQYEFFVERAAQEEILDFDPLSVSMLRIGFGVDIDGELQYCTALLESKLPSLWENLTYGEGPNSLVRIGGLCQVKLEGGSRWQPMQVRGHYDEAGQPSATKEFGDELPIETDVLQGAGAEHVLTVLQYIAS